MLYAVQRLVPTAKCAHPPPPQVASGDPEADSETTIFSPPSVLDEVWHLLLLRPRVYTAVCRSFGVAHLIDHDPRLASSHGNDARDARRRAAVDAYRHAYGIPPPYLWREEDQSEYEGEDEEPPAPKRARGGGQAGRARVPLLARPPRCTACATTTSRRRTHCTWCSA